MPRRFWEVDATRGFALGLMLLFNWSFALRFLDIWTIVSPKSQLYWWVFPRFIGFLFIFIVGVSLTLSLNRLQRNQPENWRTIRNRKYVRRGLWILGLGLGITLVTFVLYPDRFIFFGILHLIGVSIILSIPFLTRKWEALLAGLTFVGATFWLQTITVNSRLLGAIGFTPQVNTLDFFPLFPWTGVVLLGIWTGHVLYPDGHRGVPSRIVTNAPPATPLLKPLQILGQHTLIIYLAHQPALVGLLLLLGFDVL